MDIEGGTNTYRGTFAHIARFTGSNISATDVQSYYGIDCSGGGRSLNITDISTLLLAKRDTTHPGKLLVVGKRDNTANKLSIVGASVNGQAPYVLDQPYQHVQLIWSFDGWYIVGGS